MASQITIHLQSPPFTFPTPDPHCQPDKLKDRLNLILRIVKYQPFSTNVYLPSSIFDFDNVIIPLFSVKLAAFEQLQSISFGQQTPSILWTISSKIFRALLSLKVAMSLGCDVVGGRVEDELRVAQQSFHIGSQRKRAPIDRSVPRYPDHSRVREERRNDE